MFLWQLRLLKLKYWMVLFLLRLKLILKTIRDSHPWRKKHLALVFLYETPITLASEQPLIGPDMDSLVSLLSKVLEKEKKRKKQTEEDPEEETDGEMSQEREERQKKR